LEIASTIPEEQINPTDDQILAWIGDKLLDNEEDLYMVKSDITSRSAAFTDVISSDDDLEALTELNNLFQFAEKEDLIAVKVQVGQSNEMKLLATTILPKSHANKALMLRRNFYLSDHDIEESDIISFDIPTYQKRKVIVDPRPGQRVTYAMGIDYYGEQKMSILRMVMEIMKKDKGGLGLHAGSKTYHLTNGEKKGAIIFGLSGTGKTTLTAHDHGKKEPVKDVDILQDDIVLITPQAEVFGTEYGMYVKCADVPDHELITRAVTRKDPDRAVIENVMVTADGKIDWNDYSHTHNSRAIVPRSNVDGAAEDIDLPQLNMILFNTRRPELPPIGRLTNAEQAAAYYALGESIVTSAETKDPNVVGTAKRVVGFDPFILDEIHVNINRMRKIFDNNPDVKAYVVNTGYIGEEENDIAVEDTLACIEGVLLDNLEWELDEDLGYEVPKSVNGTDWDRLLPRKHFGDDEFAKMMTSLREERKAHLNTFSGIDEEIINSL